MSTTASGAESISVPRAGTRDRAIKRQRNYGWLQWILVVFVMLFCLFPFYWLGNTSLKTGDQLSSASIVPSSPTLANYKPIFQDSTFTTAPRHPAIVALTTTLLALLVGSFCAYAIARLRFRHKFALLALILSITT